MKEKERSRIRVVQMDNFRGLLGIRSMDRFLNAWIKELCRVKKWVNERINEGVLLWFGHAERMENDRIAKRDYVVVYAGSCLVSGKGIATHKQLWTICWETWERLDDYNYL